MATEDIRWIQRFSHFKSAFQSLKDAVELSNQRKLSELEQQGLIQSFEFTHELAWKVFKDYFEYQGTVDITGSRDAAREAFQKGLVKDGQVWMEMIKSRNQTSHTYNQSVADDIVLKIRQDYFSEFLSFEKKMSELASK